MSDEPRYIIPCLLASPIQDYQGELVDLIAERFGLTFTQRQAIPAHFTLKYHFATRDIGEVERLIGDFAREREPSPVEVGGFGPSSAGRDFVSSGSSSPLTRGGSPAPSTTSPFCKR